VNIWSSYFLFFVHSSCILLTVALVLFGLYVRHLYKVRAERKLREQVKSILFEYAEYVPPSDVEMEDRNSGHGLLSGNDNL